MLNNCKVDKWLNHQCPFIYILFISEYKACPEARKENIEVKSLQKCRVRAQDIEDPADYISPWHVLRWDIAVEHLALEHLKCYRIYIQLIRVKPYLIHILHLNKYVYKEDCDTANDTFMIQHPLNHRRIRMSHFVNLTMNIF